MTIRTALLLSFTIGALFGFGGLWIFADSPKASEPVAASNLRSVTPLAPTEVEAARLLPNNECEPSIGVGRAPTDLGAEQEDVARLTGELDKSIAALFDAGPRSYGRAGAEIEICRTALADLTSKEALVKRLDRNRARDEAFDDGALAESGIDAQDLDWIRDRWEQARLKKLDLSGRQARGERISSEEWHGAIEQELREELGEDGYDAMLYATNQENRVALRGVLENSPAYRAGLRTGGVVFRCDGRRIFIPLELEECASGGAAGESIAIELVTNHGRTKQYWIERGSLGATEVVAVKFQP